MPLLVVFTRAARSDLVEIWTWIADDDPETADRFVGRLRDAALALGRTPGMGRGRDELAVGVRSFPVGRHVIFYRVESDAVQVLRVLNGYRDVDALF